MNSITINPFETLGEIKPMNGVNNGPITGGTDLSEYYKDLKIPFVRLHDTTWPYPQVVDIPQIFRNFDADPYDPKNYDFVLTDQFVCPIVETGAQVIYRLGTSIEHLKVKRFIFPPKDYEKWAVICEHIIRHYNEGWANGYNLGIKYWEIWNEPEDNDGNRTFMWIGKKEEYYGLYETASKHLKKVFGDSICVGGYAATNLRGHEEGQNDYFKYLLGYFYDFLDYIKKHECPLDFFSFHDYRDEYDLMAGCARHARKKLDEAGYQNAEIIFDEWSGSFSFKDNSPFLKYNTVWAAVFIANVMIAIQHSPINIATYYDAQPFNGFCALWDRNCQKLKGYYTFLFFRFLRDLGTEVALSLKGEKLHALAAADGTKCGFILTNEGAKTKLSIKFEGMKPKKMRAYAISADRDGELIKEGVFSSVNVPAQSVLYVEAE